MQEETASASQKSVGQMPGAGGGQPSKRSKKKVNTGKSGEDTNNAEVPGAEGGQPSKQTYWPKKGKKLCLPRKRKPVKAVAGGV